MAVELEWNEAGWDQIIKEAVEKHLVPRAHKVADACNLDLILSAIRRRNRSRDGIIHDAREYNAVADDPAQRIADVGKGFVVGDEVVDGPNEGEPLRKRDYRITVITGSAAAMRLNAKHHTLLKHLNEGAE